MALLVDKSEDRQWRTAIVADSSKARCSIGRLEAFGIEYHVIADEPRKSRILVPRNRLEEVVELLDGLDLATFGQSRKTGRPQNIRRPLRLLMAIPLGGGIGLGFSAMLGNQASFGTVLPAICAGLACILVAVPEPEVLRS